ncbi:MAG: transcription termination factor NusA [Patescibacteria group bacterium]
MDLKTIKSSLEELAEEKGISKEKVIETIELALAAAYKRDYGKHGQIVRAEFNLETGVISFRQIKIVLDESMIKPEGETGEDEKFSDKDESLLSGENNEIRKVRFNPERHLLIEEAAKIKPDVIAGEELEFPLEIHHDYGRIAAQTAKQVIIQRVREAEREAIYNEFKEKQGGVVSGIVQRIEGRNVYIDLGRTTAVLPAEEQVPHEHYRMGERIKGLLLMTDKNPRSPSIYLSRTHPRFVSKLFEIEVPEIAQGIVEIKGIAREAGSRSKIAVISKEDSIDPVGSMVGQKGVRVSTVIAELGGEKIDIISWSDDPARFISNALSPAKVLDIELDDAAHEAHVLVDEAQLSLAIGRSGQNVRLAAKLSGWKIDIRSRNGEEVASEKPEKGSGSITEEI